MYQAAAKDYRKSRTKHKIEYFNSLITKSSENQSPVFRIADSLLHKTSEMTLPAHNDPVTLVQVFLCFFDGKVAKMKSSLPVPDSNQNPFPEPSTSVNYISLETSCFGLQEEKPQTAHLIFFTWASHIAASVLMGLSTPTQTIINFRIIKNPISGWCTGTYQGITNQGLSTGSGSSLFKSCLPALLPTLTASVNQSLQTGVIPSSLR